VQAGAGAVQAQAAGIAKNETRAKWPSGCQADGRARAAGGAARSKVESTFMTNVSAQRTVYDRTASDGHYTRAPARRPARRLTAARAVSLRDRPARIWPALVPPVSAVIDHSRTDQRKWSEPP